MKNINIAIDGHSSCGKSTIAKQLAQHFSYLYIDTGAMYRAVCLFCLNNGIIVDGEIDLLKLEKHLDDINISFSFNNNTNKSETFLNGVNVEEEIRGLWVSDNVSNISRVKTVRDKLIHIQRTIGADKGVVMDGRDIGSVVFPNAELKLFITASLEERTKRRFADLEGVSLEKVMSNLELRDSDDSSRKENPLIQTKDAILIDNTFLTKEEQFSIILDHCQNAMS
jgi:CMP/dCMP kinase